MQTLRNFTLATRGNLVNVESIDRIASRTDSGFWYSLVLQRQDSDGLAMGYANAVRGVTTGLTWSKYSGAQIRRLMDAAGQATPRHAQGTQRSPVHPALWPKDFGLRSRADYRHVARQQF